VFDKLTFLVAFLIEKANLQRAQTIGLHKIFAKAANFNQTMFFSFLFLFKRKD